MEAHNTTGIEPINADSLWLIGARAKGGHRNNVYHGNFAPQIPNDLIRRFTAEDDVVLDMFMGSGTTLFECETLNRRFIGFDINKTILETVRKQISSSPFRKYTMHLCNVCDTESVKTLLTDDLNTFGRKYADIVFSHPPYLNIIRFTEESSDLSHLADLHVFTKAYLHGVENIWPFLKKDGILVLVVGDIYSNREVVPLGFTLMDAIRQNFNCLLKGIVVKDMVGNRAKIGQEALWRYRALKWGTFLFKHEYVFVFRKTR